ncbi:STAS domain-containing protein [Kitasatospora sp. NPDC001309]|uniref:STAS domain-containing protein n=1 Tax=Kitasatospora sp. NPDC001309 TaxID=3364013 RepID=UPI0036AFD62A
MTTPPGSGRRKHAGPRHVPTPRLRITTTAAPGGTVIVRLDGEVDQDDRPQLDDALTVALDKRPNRLVVDLAGLTFCYSVCLNALLTARRTANAVGVVMALAAPLPQTVRVLELTGVDEVFTLYPSVRAALAGAPGQKTERGERP